MGAYDGAVEAFVNAVNAPSEEIRTEELEKAVVEDLTFFGPEEEEAFGSSDELKEYLRQISQMLPSGTTLERTSPVHEHHDHIRWGFAFKAPDDTEIFRFEFFGEGTDGKFGKIILFEVTHG
jgi:hypothetical protein